jgi:hypothetical protein
MKCRVYYLIVNFPTERSLLGVVAEGALRENALKKCSEGRRKEFPFLRKFSLHYCIFSVFCTATEVTAPKNGV